MLNSPPNPAVRHGGNARDRGALRKWTQPGFTLVDLLVLVVLLVFVAAAFHPALSRTRAQSRSIACTTNLGLFGAALQVYAIESLGWLPGVNTSGVAVRTKVGIPGALNHSYLPVQSHDWMTPVLCNYLPLPDNRAARWYALRTVFQCPSQKADAFAYTGPDIPDLPDFAQYSWPASSYLMPLRFALWGAVALRRSSGHARSATVHPDLRRDRSGLLGSAERGLCIAP